MKKIMFLLLLSGLFFTATAQRATTMPLTAGDTITNTGTAAKVVTLTSGYAGVAVQVVLTRLSGTAGGTVALQGSNDGTTYTAIGSAYTVTNSASQSTMFYLAEPVPVYIKVLATGTGTMSVVQTVKYVLRKHD